MPPSNSPTLPPPLPRRQGRDDPGLVRELDQREAQLAAKLAEIRRSRPEVEESPASSHAALKLQVRDWKGLAGLVAAVGAIALGAWNRIEKAPLPRVEAQGTTIHEVKQLLDKTREELGEAQTHARETYKIAKCLRDAQDDLNSRVTPPPDKLKSTRRPRPWEDDCPELPRPP